MPALMLICFLACGGTSESTPPEELVAEEKAPDTPEPTGLVVKATDPKLEVGSEITVHVRKTTESSSFTVTGPFSETTTLTAVEAPFGGGGVNEAMLVPAVTATVGDVEVTRMGLRAPREGEGEPASSASVSVEGSDTSWMNSYIAEDGEGNYHMWMDVHVVP